MARESTIGVCGLLALSLVAPTASATVVSFQQGVGGYTGTQDTFLNEAAPEASYGALTVAIAGLDPTTTPTATRRTGLIRFDVSSLLGQYETINSATLTVYQRETSFQFPNDFDVSVYAVSAANGGWVQGTTDTAAPNTAGNPDWLHLSHDATPWAGSAGLSTPGVDYDATPLSTVTWNSGASSTTDKNNTAYTFTLPPSLIASWVGGTNTGLMIQKTDFSSAGLAQYAAAEWTADPDGTAGPLTPAQIRPLLTIDYTPIPEPAGLALVALGGLAVARRRRT